MAYVNTGVKRSLRITITKTINNVPVIGYPRTYDGQISWGDENYKTLTDQQAQKLTDEEYDARLSALLLHIQSLEPGYKPATDNTNEPQITDTDTCIPPPTTTTTTIGATTTTEAPTTTTTPAGTTTTSSSGTTTAAPTTTTTVPGTTTTTAAATTTTTDFGAAADFFVSSSGGDDSNTGTSELDAWATINKVNTSTFSAGQTIAFKAGDVWEETLTPPNSGTTGNPITFGAYGTGDKPIIYGSDEITGWTVHSGNIYKATFTSTPKNLFYDNNRLRVARYPNSGYVLITSVGSSTSITASSLPNIDHTGAVMNARMNNWAVETKTVTSSTNTNTTLGLNSASYYTYNVGDGFFLCNKLEYLDEAGEWYYDSGTNTIYVWLPGDADPATKTMRASVRDDLVSINNKDYLTIENLELRHANNYAINSDLADHLTIDGVDIYDPNLSGIYADHDTYLTVNDVYLTGANYRGIAANTSNASITNNTIEDTAIFNNIGIDGIGYRNDGVAVYIWSGDSNTIQYNRIDNVSYHGIRWQSTSTLIDKNYISNTCLWRDDGGAIYTWSDSYPSSSLRVVGSTISNNIIMHSYGSREGTVSDRSYGYGIYMDDYVYDVDIKNNTIGFTGHGGIMLHLNANILVSNNTIFSSRYGVFVHSEQADSYVYDNTIYVRDRDFENYRDEYLIANRFNASIVSDSNRYYSHYNTNVFRNDPSDNLDFSTWKSQTGNDANSTIDLSSLTVGHSDTIFVNPTSTVKTFFLNGATANDIDGNSISTSFTVSAWNSKIITGTDLNLISETESTTTTTV